MTIDWVMTPGDCQGCCLLLQEDFSKYHMTFYFIKLRITMYLLKSLLTFKNPIKNLKVVILIINQIMFYWKYNNIYLLIWYKSVDIHETNTCTNKANEGELEKFWLFIEDSETSIDSSILYMSIVCYLLTLGPPLSPCVVLTPSARVVVSAQNWESFMRSGK